MYIYIYKKIYLHMYIYTCIYSHPGVDRIWFLKGVLFSLKNTVIFDPIDRILISRCFQPSVLSKTASSTISYLGVWEMIFFCF